MRVSLCPRFGSDENFILGTSLLQESLYTETRMPDPSGPNLNITLSGPHFPTKNCMAQNCHLQKPRDLGITLETCKFQLVIVNYAGRNVSVFIDNNREPCLCFQSALFQESLAHWRENEQFKLNSLQFSNSMCLCPCPTFNIDSSAGFQMSLSEETRPKSISIWQRMIKRPKVKIY